MATSAPDAGTDAPPPPSSPAPVGGGARDPLTTARTPRHSNKDRAAGGNNEEGNGDGSAGTAGGPPASLRVSAVPDATPASSGPVGPPSSRSRAGRVHSHPYHHPPPYHRGGVVDPYYPPPHPDTYYADPYYHHPDPYYHGHRHGADYRHAVGGGGRAPPPPGGYYDVPGRHPYYPPPWGYDHDPYADEAGGAVAGQRVPGARERSGSRDGGPGLRAVSSSFSAGSGGERDGAGERAGEFFVVAPCLSVRSCREREGPRR